MSDTANNTEQTEKSSEIYEISLLDLFTILVEKRKFIAKIACGFALLAIIYSLLATPVYESKLEIMPSGGQKMSGAMAMLAATGMGNLLGGGMTTTADTVVGIIQSPAVLDKVIDSKQLLTREDEGWSIGKLVRGMFKIQMEPRSLEKTREALSKQISATSDIKTGLISLSVCAKTPEFSVEMTQAVFDATQSVMRTLATSPSAQSRKVLEDQIRDVGAELSKAEEELGIYNVKKTLAGETPADVTALARMQSMMLEKELELRAARRFGTEKNPQVKQLQAEYDAMKRKFANDFQIENVKTTGSNEAFDYNAKLRDYKLKEATYNGLLAQLENAKITEDDEPLVIQQIGKPTLPEKRSKPQRRKIVILATLLGIFIGIFAAFAQHFYELGKKDKETAEQIEYIANAFKQDIETVKKKIGKKK